MKVRAIASLVMALCFAVGSASASSIGLFYDAGATDCDTALPTPGQFSLHAVAILGADAAAAGITGAEFRIDGLDASWFVNAIPNPAANVTLGNPALGGGNIAFPQCQVGAMVGLYRFDIFATSPPGERIFRINRHTNPSNLMFQCSLVSLCDPNFTLLCVGAGQAFMNRSVNCTVGVEPATWTTVKSLYTN